MKINESADYTRFEVYPQNREVAKEKYLLKSMKQYGWITAFPMYVVKNGSTRMKIKDGHHRFAVAKQLGIPVKYVCLEDNGMSVAEMNKTHRQWTLADYTKSFQRQGRSDYDYLQKFCERTKIGLSPARSILSGITGTFQESKTDRFKNGEFSCTEEGVAAGCVVEKIVEYLRKGGCSFASHNQLVLAIAKVCTVPEVDKNILIKKIKTFPGMLIKQPTTAAFIENIERLYNQQNRNKLPIAHLVKEKMDSRKISVSEKARYRRA